MEAKYMPAEIWSSNWTVTIDQGKRVFTEEVITRIPHFLLVNDPDFIKRVSLKFPDTVAMKTQFSKPLNIKIEYIKKIGIVNQIIEEDPWN